jgi:exodeoxyribonuclease III
MPKKTTIQATSEEKVVAKKASVKKRKIEEVDEEEDHIVEEPKVKKTEAKASVAKGSSASNATKSNLDDTVEEVSEESEEEVRKAPSAKKSKATTAKSSTAKASSASNAKKRKLEDRLEEESEESDDEVKKAPSAKRNVKSSTAKKAKSTAALEEYSSGEEFEEPTKAKKGGKSSSGSKVSTAKKSTFKSSNAMDVTEKEVKVKKKAEDDDEDEGEAMVIPPTDFKTPLLAPGELKIVSWNVAGFRAVQRKGFEAYIKQESPDVICLQETKIASASEMLYGYHASFFGCKAKPGLHGTGILSKEKPIKVELVSTLDEEGRVMVAEFDKFFILNTYVPHSGQRLERIPFRLEWDKGLQALFLSLQKTKPVLWCGDLNVAHHPIDIANPNGNVRSSEQVDTNLIPFVAPNINTCFAEYQKRTAGFTDVERKSFGDFLSTNGLIDTYRKRNPEEKDCYSFWTYKRQSRSKNIGWRMDYFIVSPNIDSFITQAYIRKHIHGSEYATQHTTTLNVIAKAYYCPSM